MRNRVSRRSSGGRGLRGLGALAGGAWAASGAAIAQISFAPPVPYVSGDQTFGVVTADFNGDEIIDIAACNAQSNSVRVFLGLGGGAFGAQAPMPVAGRPIKIAAGDVNGDGAIDLVTANISAGGVTVLRGTGDGTFTTLATLAMASSTIDVALADFNEDGKLDIATVNRFGHNVTVRLGNGNGAFSAVMATALGVEAGPGAIAVGDLDNDGRPDIVTANSFGDTISVLRGLGAGIFSHMAYPAGEFPVSVAVGDVNNDGFLDVVATSLTGADMRVYFNAADGSAAIIDPGPGLPVGDAVRVVALADLDASGGLDIFFCNCVDDTLWVYGDMFDALRIIPAGDCPEDVVAADFDGDGRIDLATADFVGDSVSVLINTTPIAPPAPFALLSPKDDAVNVALTPTLVWDAHPTGALAYTARIALDEAMTSVVHEDEGERAGFYEVPAGALAGDETYWWTVEASNPGGGTAPAARRFFTVRTADLNGDGRVNSEDLAILLGNWGGPG